MTQITKADYRAKPEQFKCSSLYGYRGADKEFIRVYEYVCQYDKRQFLLDALHHATIGSKSSDSRINKGGCTALIQFILAELAALASSSASAASSASPASFAPAQPSYGALQTELTAVKKSNATLTQDKAAVDAQLAALAAAPLTPDLTTVLGCVQQLANDHEAHLTYENGKQTLLGANPTQLSNDQTNLALELYGISIDTTLKTKQALRAISFPNANLASVLQLTGLGVGDAVYVLAAFADLRKGKICAPRNRRIGNRATADVTTWGPVQVRALLAANGLAQFSGFFDEHGIHGDVLLALNITELGMVEPLFFDHLDEFTTALAPLAATVGSTASFDASFAAPASTAGPAAVLMPI